MLTRSTKNKYSDKNRTLLSRQEDWWAFFYFHCSIRPSMTVISASRSVSAPTAKACADELNFSKVIWLELFPRLNEQRFSSNWWTSSRVVAKAARKISQKHINRSNVRYRSLDSRANQQRSNWLHSKKRGHSQVDDFDTAGNTHVPRHRCLR